ncbi:hypothetical protein CR513_47289, partial [Mucuna pruriens]
MKLGKERVRKLAAVGRPPKTSRIKRRKYEMFGRRDWTPLENSEEPWVPVMESVEMELVEMESAEEPDPKSDSGATSTASNQTSNHFWRKAFERKHGNFLNILDIEVQLAALEVLAQYYDAPLRCFTFKDFQLTPTLEEYERLLGLPLGESPHYFHRG